MARLNIEMKIFADLRFVELCIDLKDRELAIGVLVNAWMVAQKYWAPDEKLIPLTIFQKLRGANFLLKCGLAVRRKKGVYFCGSREHFAWLIQKYDASYKSAESRRNKSPYGDRTVTGSHPPTPTHAQRNHINESFTRREFAKRTKAVAREILNTAALAQGAPHGPPLALQERKE